MAYVSLDQWSYQKRLVKRLPLRMPVPLQLIQHLERLRPGSPLPPGVLEHLRRLPPGMFQPGMYRRLQSLRTGSPLPPDLQGLGNPGFFKKVFKPIRKVLKPIYRPIVAAIKPFVRPLVAMIPGIGPIASTVVGAAQAMRLDMKAKQQVAASIQAAPSWGQMSPSEQQAILNAIMAGVVPSVQAPPDVAQTYQQAVQRQAATHPEWGRPAPALPGGPEFPAPAVAEAGPGTGTVLGIGAAAVVGMMLLGGRR